MDLTPIDISINTSGIFQLKEEKEINKQIECEMVLCYMDKHFDTESNSIKYYKKLKKKITTFKKEVYIKLDEEDKQIILLLDKYTQKLINQSIKNNIEQMKEILAQKNKTIV
mgnify:CR=1 FL=1